MTTIDSARRLLEVRGFVLTDRNGVANQPYDIWRRGKTEAWLFHNAEWHCGRYIGPCDELGLKVLELVIGEEAYAHG